MNSLYPLPNSDKYFMGTLIAFEMCFPGKKKGARLLLSKELPVPSFVYYRR
jgi:hypothetical protein